MIDGTHEYNHASYGQIRRQAFVSGTHVQWGTLRSGWMGSQSAGEKMNLSPFLTIPLSHSATYF